MIPSWLIQLIGFIGALFLILSFQQNKRKRILFVILIGQVFFISHFALLGAWTGVGMNIVGITRTIIFFYREEKKWAAYWFWPVIFVVGFGLAGWITFDTWHSVLPPIAMSIESVGLWMKKPATIRKINLFPHPLWFIYNVAIGSWPGIFTEVFVFVSIVVGIWRFDIKKSRRTEEQRS